MADTHDAVVTATGKPFEVVLPGIAMGGWVWEYQPCLFTVLDSVTWDALEDGPPGTSARQRFRFYGVKYDAILHFVAKRPWLPMEPGRSLIVVVKVAKEVGGG